MSFAYVCACFLLGGAWRRWLGEFDTGRRLWKVLAAMIVFSALGYFMTASQPTPHTMLKWKLTSIAFSHELQRVAFSALLAGSIIFVLTVRMQFDKLVWSAVRWGITGLAPTAVLALERYFVDGSLFWLALLAVPICALAGASWEFLRRIWSDPETWPTVKIGRWYVFQGYTSWGEFAAGSLTFGLIFSLRMVY